MRIEKITDINIVDGSVHYNMISEKGGRVHFALFGNEMCAIDFDCPGEGRLLLWGLERYAEKYGLSLTISNVINPRLETILRKAGYVDYYIRDEFADDTIQCWRKKKEK